MKEAASGPRDALNATCLSMDICMGLWERMGLGWTISQRSTLQEYIVPEGEPAINMAPAPETTFRYRM